ncbi:hypothetical protein NQZ68_022552 [Dissostichus eleginoides]|nr:hypothetical protein NQZ68_022552 [Dissostichus eleginoides]
MEHIRHGFGERIPEDVSLQLVMSCGNKLVTPNIQEGQELNGMLIHMIFKTKALYLRPSRTLLAMIKPGNSGLPGSCQSKSSGSAPERQKLFTRAQTDSASE